MKKSFAYYIRYELLNNLYNGYSFFFGAIFPTVLVVLIEKSALKDLSGSIKLEAATSLVLGMGTIVPLATVFLGYAASYANELEKEIPSRLHLFGFSHQFILLGKLVSNFIFLTGCFIIYIVPTLLFVSIEKPKSIVMPLTYIVFMYIFSACLLILAHGISNLIRKFGPTYGIVMGIYFGMMMLGGTMGVSADSFPDKLQMISKLLPNNQFAVNYIDFWVGRDYSIAPMIQSLVTFGAIGIVVLLISFKVKGKN